jgi:hypothetical protein
MMVILISDSRILGLVSEGAWRIATPVGHTLVNIESRFLPRSHSNTQSAMRDAGHRMLTSPLQRRRRRADT